MAVTREQKEDELARKLLVQWANEHVIWGDDQEVSAREGQESSSAKNPHIFVVEVRQTKEAPSSWRAREVTDSGVSSLVSSMKNSVMTNMLWKGVVFIDDDSTLPTHQQLSANMAAVYDSGLYLLAGNHRRRAMLQCQDNGYLEPAYKFVNIELYLCKDTSESRRNLRLLGTMLNRLDHVKSNMTFYDWCISMRQSYESIRHLESRSEKEFKEHEQQVLASFRIAWYAKSSSSHTLTWRMIKQSDRVWELILKYLEGTLETRTDKAGVLLGGETHNSY